MLEFHNNKILHVENVTLIVKDIQRSIKFYQESLGMVLHENNEGYYELGTQEKVLVRLKEDVNAKAKERTTGLYHFAILLPNRKFLGQIINHFIKIKQKIVGGSDHGVSEALYLNDPDGNGIEIYADRKKEAWPTKNNEIIMYTEEMDYNDLILNAEEAEYDEIPKNTVIGHVHFHVRDLLEATNFFIDILGFNQMLFYGDSANFLSDGMYHHHVGINTWNGNVKDRDNNMVGLESYQLNIPLNKRKEVIDRIIENNILINEIDNKKYILDINNVKVFL